MLTLIFDELQGFVPQWRSAVGDQPVSVAVGDFDADSDLETLLFFDGVRDSR